MSSSHSIEEAVKAIALGQFVVVIDDEDRENEGDLILAAEKATPEKIAFMLRHTSGIICVPMVSQRLEDLHLEPMVAHNDEVHRTAFTVSVDAFQGTTTGVSAADRVATILALANPKARPSDFRRPGHIFPLRYREGGVLKRAGHTEAAIDLMHLAEMYPAGVLCELMNSDGTMSRRNELLQFASDHNLPFISIADLVRYRRRKEKLVERVSTARLPTPFGLFEAIVYTSLLDGIEHIALVCGSVEGQSNVLVRVHSECLTGDVFGSKRCDCGAQLQQSLQLIAKEGQGVVVYLRGHEGRGIGLGHKMRAYTLQDQGQDTVEANTALGFPADSREYGIGAQILSDLGITTIRLLTNNPAKYGGLNGYDIHIGERVPLITPATSENAHYLHTKRHKLGHLLEV